MVAILLDSSLLVSASLPLHGKDHTVQKQPGPGVLALLASPAGVWAFSDGRPPSANMSTRGEILSFILANPGVYLREISDDLALPMGVVQYHVWVLNRDGELDECRSGRYRRLFGATRYEEDERRMISLMRQGTAGKIVAALVDEGPIAHARLAALLGLSSQALSWQMRRLRATGVVELAPLSDHEGKRYRLADGFREEAASWRARGP